MTDVAECITGGEPPQPAPEYGYPLRVALGYVPPGGWPFRQVPEQRQPWPPRRYDAKRIIREGRQS